MEGRVEGSLVRAVGNGEETVDDDGEGVGVKDGVVYGVGVDEYLRR